MGNMCSCSYEHEEKQRSSRKVSVLKKQSIKTTTDASQSKIILQSLKDKFKASSGAHHDLADFQIVSELGRGGQADVFQVRLGFPTSSTRRTTRCHRTFALKRIFKNNQVNKKHSLELGKSIIMSNGCPFIMQGIATYEDEDYMYHVMEKARGGDMAGFVSPNSVKGQLFKSLGEDGIRNVVAGVILGLEYLHRKNIIYCDLKLENVLIGSDGYPVLVDFQMAVHGRYVDSCGYRGTMNYVAPEVFIQDKVDKAMDIWALGIFLYALAYGHTPFSSEDVASQHFLLECKKRQNKFYHPTKVISKELSSLINAILKTSPKQRLGYCSLGQIKGHSFFKGFDWRKYERKEAQNPLEEIVSKAEASILANSRSLDEQCIVSRDIMKKKRKESAETECDEFVGEEFE